MLADDENINKRIRKRILKTQLFKINQIMASTDPSLNC